MSIWAKHRLQQKLLAELPAMLQSAVILDKALVNGVHFNITGELKIIVYMYNNSYISFMYMYMFR